LISDLSESYGPTISVFPYVPCMDLPTLWSFF
jgi:hypothetical protein